MVATKTGPKKITRPAIRFYGGKFRLGPWIISHFPPHLCYCEPFAGSASVLLQKAKSDVEVINDLDREVIHFFEILRTKPKELIRSIELTPFSRAELLLSYEHSEDPLEQARRFYVRVWQGWSPRTNHKTGWRFEKRGRSWQTTIENWNNTGYLWQIVGRLKLVQLECDDALKVITRFDSPDTLFYCDPPYLEETRSERWGKYAYRFELPPEYHTALAERLNAIQGMAVISGYKSEAYEALYRGWKMFCKPLRTMSKQIKTEYIWVSPKALTRGIQSHMFNT